MKHKPKKPKRKGTTRRKNWLERIRAGLVKYIPANKQNSHEHKNTLLNKQLQTKRIETHTKK
jgi:hypothetical protein